MRLIMPPREWIEKFKGKFDQGWDKVREETLARQKKMGIVPANARLTARPKEVQAWSSLDAEQKALYARMMEVYAAALAHCDAQIGRTIDAIDKMGELDNTLIIFIQGDNGASGEGTLQGLSKAKKYKVYPLQTSFADRVDPAIRPNLTRGRSMFDYYPGAVRIPEGATPDVKNRSYSMTADVEVPAGGANGVIATQGGRFGGWGLLLLEGKPLFVHAYSNQPQHKYRVASSQPLTPGKHAIHFDFQYDGGGKGKGGMGTLFIDGTQVEQSRIEHTVGGRFSLDETFDVGEDTGTPLLEDYVDRMPFKFTGELERFTIQLR